MATVSPAGAHAAVAGGEPVVRVVDATVIAVVVGAPGIVDDGVEPPALVVGSTVGSTVVAAPLVTVESSED